MDLITLDKTEAAHAAPLGITTTKEDIPLQERLRAISGVLDIDDNPTTLYLTPDEEGEDREIEITDSTRLALEANIVAVNTDRYIVVGGLIREDDTENPMDAMDAEGKIIHKEHDEKEYLAAFGCDQYGDFCWSNISDAVTEKIWKDIFLADRALLEDLIAASEKHHTFVEGNDKPSFVLDHLSSVISERNPEEYCDELCSLLCDNADAVEVSAILNAFDMNTRAQAIANTCMEIALSSGQIGTHLAVALNISGYYSKTARVSGSVTRCDAKDCEGVWVPDDCAKENILSNVKHRHPRIHPAHPDYTKVLHAEALEYAKSCLSTWNQWQDGDVWGVCVYVIDRETGDRLDEHDDEVWGFYGEEYATEELEGNIVAAVSRMLQTTH